MSASATGSEPPGRRGSRVGRLAICAFLALFAVEAGIAAREDSVTIDEFVHLPVGLYMLRHGDLTPDPINPPLSRMLPALAVAPGSNVVEPAFNANHWGMGLDFMDRNFDTYQSIFVRARCVVIALAILLGVLVAAWTFELYGEGAAVVASFLFAMSPSLLAYGHLVTADLGGALGFTLTTYALWRYLEARSPSRAALVGVAFGVAMLLKLSSLALVVVISLCGAIEIAAAQRSERPHVARSLLGGIVIMGLAATAVIDLGYGFAGVGRPLGALRIRSGGPVAALSTWAPWMPSPLPAVFLRGLDLAMTGRESARVPYYLMGAFSARGWWYYHLVAFVLKTPLPMLLAGGISLASVLAGRTRGPREHCLAVGVLVVFLVNALLNPLNVGVRHVLPAVPLLLVLVSPLLSDPITRVRARPVTRPTVVRAALSALALGWLAVGTVRVAPRYLEYFNEIAGGPLAGHRWLIDSNLDWGQDLIRLSRYMREHHLSSISLAYMGTVHPWVYGIRFTPLTPESHGTAVISASTLMGSSLAIWSDPRHHAGPPAEGYAWLRATEPIARVGSMFVFDLH